MSNNRMKIGSYIILKTIYRLIKKNQSAGLLILKIFHILQPRLMTPQLLVCSCFHLYIYMHCSNRVTVKLLKHAAGQYSYWIKLTNLVKHTTCSLGPSLKTQSLWLQSILVNVEFDSLLHLCLISPFIFVKPQFKWMFFF